MKTLAEELEWQLTTWTPILSPFGCRYCLAESPSPIDSPVALAYAVDSAVEQQSLSNHCH